MSVHVMCQSIQSFSIPQTTHDHCPYLDGEFEPEGSSVFSGMEMSGMESEVFKGNW